MDGKNSEGTNSAPIIDGDLIILKESFFSAMKSAHHIFGADAFRRIDPEKRRGPINRAIFESQSIALSDYKFEVIEKYSEKIRLAFIELFSDPSYTKSVTVGTGAPSSVFLRLNETKRILKEIVND